MRNGVCLPPSLPSSLSLSRSLFSGVSSDGRSYRASLKGFHGPSRTKVYHRQWNNFFSRIEHDRADTHLMSSCTTATVAPDAKEGSSGSYSAVVRKVGWSVGGHLLPPSLSLSRSLPSCSAVSLHSWSTDPIESLSFDTSSQ